MEVLANADGSTSAIYFEYRTQTTVTSVSFKRSH